MTTVSSYIRDVVKADRKGQGPYLTISRQYGAAGIRLAEALTPRLSELTGQPWRLVGKEILEEAAAELHASPEIIEARRRQEPSLFVGLFKALNPSFIPSGPEIRQTITEVIRRLAYNGHVILVGQGSAPATYEIPGGLHLRVVAPLAWRAEDIARRHDLTTNQAREKIQAEEHARDYLRSLYSKFQPESTSFDLVVDNRSFPVPQLTDLVISAMRLKGLVPG